MPPKVNKPYQPDGQECALLLLSLVGKKEKEIKREIARVRLAELTLKRLWSRQRLTDQFLHEVQEWLFRAGWVLFYAGTTFALVKVVAVEGWPRLTSKLMADELRQVARGEYDFLSLYSMLIVDEKDDD